MNVRRLLNLFPHDELRIDGRLYMRRWYLAGWAPGRTGRWWRWGFGAVRVHEILRSDDGRAFHDHPWDFVSIGLRGSYVEERPHLRRGGTYVSRPGHPWNPRRRYRAPWLIRRQAEDLHLLTIEGRPAWTLFLTGRRQRTWGFAGPHGWVNYRDFEALGKVR